MKRAEMPVGASQQQKKAKIAGGICSPRLKSPFYSQHP